MSYLSGERDRATLQNMTAKARPGSHYYERTDGGVTGFGWGQYTATLMGTWANNVDPLYLMEEDHRSGAGWLIFDQGSEEARYPVESLNADEFAAGAPLRVLAPGAPPFGTWREVE
jgi:hypothetical protein